MVRSSAQGAEDRPLRAFLKILFSRWMLYWLVAALLLVLVPAHLIWLLDRRSKDGISTSENYFPGIFDAMAWTAEAMLAQAPRMPRHKFAHLLAILWLFTGVVFVAFFTAQLTAFADRRADSWRHQRPGRPAREGGRDPSGFHVG